MEAHQFFINASELGVRFLAEGIESLMTRRQPRTSASHSKRIDMLLSIPDVLSPEQVKTARDLLEKAISDLSAAVTLTENYQIDTANNLVFGAIPILAAYLKRHKKNP